MKFTSAVLSALLMVGANASYDPQGNEDFSSHVIDREYIAIADNLSPAECLSLKSKVEQVRINIEGAARNAADGPLRANKFEKARKCFISFKGDPETRDAVINMKEIKLVESNRLVQIKQSPASWGLDRVDQESLPLSNSPLNTGGYTGKGVNVYIVDTGINKNHNDFGSRSFFGGDFVNEGQQADGNGHGTHCAGTAAGSAYGLAKEANIYGVKVLSSSGSGSFQGVIGGIEWSVDHAPGVSSVISMSLGGGRSNAVDEAVEAAAAAGNIVVVAAGNDNRDACNYSPAGAGGNAINGGVVTVGSTERSDRRSSFSNYGKCVDIFAPGTGITSAWIGGNTATRTISGTSMACPHVAGAAALYLEKHNGDKALAQAELLEDVALGKVSNVGSGSPNKLLQTPWSTGTRPPTVPAPPTGAPTPAPTNSCWWCWWNDETAEEPATIVTPTEEASSLPMIIGIVGACVGVAGVVAGVVISKKKAKESEAPVVVRDV